MFDFDPFDPFEPPGWFIRNQRATLAEIVGRRLLAQAHAPLSPQARERHAAALAAGLARLAAHGPAVVDRYRSALQGEHEKVTQ